MTLLLDESRQRLIEALLRDDPKRILLAGDNAVAFSTVLEDKLPGATKIVLEPASSANNENKAETAADVTDQVEITAISAMAFNTLSLTHPIDALWLQLTSDYSDVSLAEIMVGKAARLAPGCVLVEQRLSSEALEQNPVMVLRPEAFYALGFVRLAKVASATAAVELYGYRLSEYKQVPDWLNARFWANPERYNSVD